MGYTYTSGLTYHEGAVGKWKYSSTLSLTSALDGGDESPPPLGRFTPRNDHQVLIVYEARWAPVPVLTGAENSAPTGIRSPDHPARSE